MQPYTKGNQRLPYALEEKPYRVATKPFQTSQQNRTIANDQTTKEFWEKSKQRELGPRIIVGH